MSFLRAFPVLLVFLLLFTIGPALSSGTTADDPSHTIKQIDELRRQGKLRAATGLAIGLVRDTEKRFGPDDPNTARVLFTLGNLYRFSGDYVQAEPLLRRALSILEKARGGHGSLLVRTLVITAMVYNSTGRHAEAEPLLKRALDIQQRATVRNQEGIAFSWTLLAEVYHFTGRQPEAEPLMQKALDIWERSDDYTPDRIAYALTAIARIYRNTGRFAEAEPLIRRSLAISEKSLGPEHGNVAFALTNLALIYRRTGRSAEAEPLYLRSLAIAEKNRSPNHPLITGTLINLAYHYGIAGKHKKANVTFKRAARLQESQRQSVFTLLTEKQKLSYIKTQEFGIYGYVSHTLGFPHVSETAVTDTFDTWLRWKGSVIEAQGRFLDAVYTSEDPKTRHKLTGLSEVKKELARLELSGPEKIGVEDYKKQTAELEKKREALEIELMSENRDFMLQKTSQDASVDVLTSYMPKDAVYLDYAKIRLLDFRKKKWMGPHYLVFLFSPGAAKSTQLLDMGPADKIDAHINAYLGEMARAGSEGKLPDETKLRKEASALYDILIRPIEGVFPGRSRILISPDGNLNLIPFEALVDPAGKYFIEKTVISYVGAGRDIIKFSRISLKGGASLIIADPDYDLGQNEIESARKSAGAPTSRARSITVRDLEGMHFDRLPDTKKEADVIEKILREMFSQTVSNRQDKKALEHTLFESHSPKVLHLATHGYFLTKPESKMADALADITDADDLLANPLLVIDNPMLRSGIVLAGVNTSLKTGQDEGMVTAEKVLGLRLKGTDLVVLSACRTGVGDVQSGEGVFGLKRAFILSGAKSIIMSLWSVPSQETVDLMSSFYTQISEGKTPSVALRQAKLSIMQKQPHPFFWAAFILTGTP